MKKKQLYAVVDIETTGGMARRDKITEVAIVLFDGEKIIDSYETLINPERSIPFEITRITGITNVMVANAPRFFEVARKIVEMTEDAIFVAHNVRFDYSFLREEFSSLGFTFTRRQLCTVVLSRKSFPGLRSYSLGNLIRHFDIHVNNRHRAMDDAIATVDILSRALSKDDGKTRADRLIVEGIRASHLPHDMTIDRINVLPESVGVYYFYNTYGHIVYIGKSINIKKRVLQHFGNLDSKTDKFIAKVSDITFELTGSELVALLLESSEIKMMQPEINKAQKSKDYPYFVYSYTDQNGYIRFGCEKSSVKSRIGKNILNHYSSKSSARSGLFAVAEMMGLCQGLTGLYEPMGGCFYFQTGTCSGACQHQESPQVYNLKAEMAIEKLKMSFDQNFFIFTEGRDDNEYGLILVEEGHYRGYGFLPVADAHLGIEEYKETIKFIKPNPEYNHIINVWLKNHPETRLLPF